MQRRTYASTRAPGPTAHFYKTFTRPVAKVLLVAVFTYQVAYWGWVKLEADEHRRTTDAEMADLESKIVLLDQARRAKDKVEEVPKKKGWW